MSSDELVALISGIALTASAFAGSYFPFRGVVLQRQLDVMVKFTEMVRVLDGRPAEGDVVGLSQQVTAVWLIAQFGRDNKFLRVPAESALRHFLTWHDEPVKTAIRDALPYLNGGAGPINSESN